MVLGLSFLMYSLVADFVDGRPSTEASASVVKSEACFSHAFGGVSIGLGGLMRYHSVQ